MRNSKNLFDDFVNKITIPESREEIRAIAYLVFQHLFDLSPAAILTEKPIGITDDDQERMNAILREINLYKPVQYILGEAEFYGRTFKVNASVLIPRPETEELVKEILDLHRSWFGNREAIIILDIGTGSGCIPVTLALEIPQAKVFATDISDDALNTAAHNAAHLNATVQFLKNDVLLDELPCAGVDIVVSNPPYIPLSEKESLNDNVALFEPPAALFVHDNDPLLFYRVITEKAAHKLVEGGLLIFEIHEKYGAGVTEIIKKAGFRNVEIITDLSGKQRIVKGFKE